MPHTPAPLSRRDWLRLATLAALPNLALRKGVAQPSVSESPFALGVASGSPTDTTVVLWTRLMTAPWSDRRTVGQGADPALAALRQADGAVPVRWELAHDEAFARVVQRGTAQALPALGDAVHVQVQGLEPGRWYWYRFIAAGVASAVGRTRTWPAPHQALQRLRLAYASCQRWEAGHFGAYHHMAREDVDAVLFLGDYVYEYAGRAGPVRIPSDTSSGGLCLTLADYRGRYAHYKTDPALQAMHAQCPWVMIWDDHEVQNDYAGPYPGTGKGPEHFAERRADAYQAFYENTPYPSSDINILLQNREHGGRLGIHRQQRVGRLANLITLDTRQYRSRQACTPGDKPGSAAFAPGSCPVWNDPGRSLLGPQQEQWLDGVFAREQTQRQQGQGAAWNLIAQQTLFGPRNLHPWSSHLPAVHWNDGWDGYAPARRRLTQSLQRHRVAGATLLGGDVHENWVGRVLADYDDERSPQVAAEFCGTSITSPSQAGSKLPQWLQNNPHFLYANVERRGYGVVDVEPDRLHVTLQGLDNVARTTPSRMTLARFEVAQADGAIQQLA